MKVAAELKIKHGLLYEQCQKHGGIKRFSESVGVSYQIMLRWLHLRGCPVPGVYTKCYTEQVEKFLVDITGVDIHDIFPKQLKEFTQLKSPTKFVSVKEIDEQSLLWIASDISARLTTSDPLSDAIVSEVQDKVREAVKKLSVKEQMVIDARFNRSLTLEGAAVEMKVTKERIRQVEKRAIKKLRDLGELAILDDSRDFSLTNRGNK